MRKEKTYYIEIKNFGFWFFNVLEFYEEDFNQMNLKKLGGFREELKLLIKRFGDKPEQYLCNLENLLNKEKVYVSIYQ